MGKKFYGGLFVVLLGSIALLLASIANGPDRDLSLKREFPSRTDSAFLGRLLSDTTLWPRWFHHLTDVQVMNGKELTQGSVLKLTINSKKTPWSGFDLIATVSELVPGRKLRLLINEDSSGKLTRLFDRVEWSVEVEPAGNGAVVRGESAARTANWRSRVFGAIATHIVLHQLYYPNLIKLAELTPQTASHQDHGSEGSSLLQGPPPGAPGAVQSLRRVLSR